MEDKITRKANFTHAEKLLLVEEFKSRESILKPKFGVGVTAKAKERAWEDITNKINAQNPLVKRTVDEIKKKWHNLTVTMKENFFKEKRNLQKTGGGVATPTMSAVDNHVLDIIGEFSPVIVGIGGGADSLAATPVTPMPVTPVRPSTPTASSFNRQSSSSSPSVVFRVSRPKSSESAGKRARQTSTAYDDYLHVEIKRCKLDMERIQAEMERIQAEKEKISLEKQKLQLEILKLRFELEEKTQMKEEDVIDFTNIEI